MRSRTLYLLLALALIPVIGHAKVYSNIMDRFYQLNTVEYSDSIVESYLEMMNDDGSFSDIDYRTEDLVYWAPIYHLDRLILMSYAYTEPGNKYYESEELFEKIRSSIDIWYVLNPVSNNRWFYVIAEPQRIGRLFIALRYGKNKLSKELETNVLNRCLERGDIPGPGVNGADVALANVYFALLQEDDDFFHISIERLLETMNYVSDKDGFQFDNSYHTHGNQLYIGGYGVNHLMVLTEVALSVRGTKFDFDDTHKQALSSYVRNTLQNCIRGEYMLYNCYGRGISRKADLKRTYQYEPIARRMMEIDPEHISEYENMLRRLLGDEPSSFAVNKYNAYYPYSDFALHVRPNYTFSVRMTSVNTIKPEHGNGEHLLGYYHGDGSTCLSIVGKEYYNIMPLWDWDKLPGITTPKLDYIPEDEEWGVPGYATFCGGLSDTESGIASFSYHDPIANVTASKSWFMFDNKIVCLGSGLKSPHDLRTTVEACWGDGGYTIIRNDGEQKYEGEAESDFDEKGLWVVHRGVGYNFPLQSDIHVENKIKQGNWHEISHEQPDSVMSDKVFTVMINHGQSDINSKGKEYGYAIYPNIEDEEKPYTSEIQDFDIIENSDSVQIVMDNSRKVLGAVFYKACEYKSDKVCLSSTAPCLFMTGLNLEGAYLSDPTKQKETEIEVIFKDPCNSEKIVYSAFFSEFTDSYLGITKKASQKVVETPLNVVRKDDSHHDSLYSIYDMTGRKIYESLYEDLEQTKGSLNNGMYIIKESIDGIVKTKKVIVAN